MHPAVAAALVSINIASDIRLQGRRRCRSSILRGAMAMIPVYALSVTSTCYSKFDALDEVLLLYST